MIKHTRKYLSIQCNVSPITGFVGMNWHVFPDVLNRPKKAQATITSACLITFTASTRYYKWICQSRNSSTCILEFWTWQPIPSPDRWHQNQKWEESSVSSRTRLDWTVLNLILITVCSGGRDIWSILHLQ